MRDKIMRVIMGLENEYGIALLNETGIRDDRDKDISSKLLHAVSEDLKCLPDTHTWPNGIFLQNGARLYIDTGGHVEYAGPECLNPYDLVIWDKAGERILEQAVNSLSKSRTFYSKSYPFVFKNNCDGLGHSTYGCHESLLVSKSCSMVQLRENLIPFLVTRVIFAGSGTLSYAPNGTGYTLSQRAGFICCETGDLSTSDRPIYHTKQEDLTQGTYKRLHLLIGDSLMSEFGTFLKVGTLALVLLLFEAGIRMGDRVKLKSPLASLKQISLDPTCKTRVPMVDGHLRSAVEIQRLYLKEVEGISKYKIFPSWAEHVIQKWRHVLKCLEQDPSLLSRKLDAYIKLEFLNRYLKKNRLSWRTIRNWAYVISVFDMHAHGIGFGEAKKEQMKHALPDVIFCIVIDYMKKHGMDWNDLSQMYQVVLNLVELDIRYHDICCDKGIFYQLDKAGVLEHRITDELSIQRAICNPPKGTRAKLRGETIRKLQGQAAWADWQVITTESRRIDFHNPFSTSGVWRIRDKSESGNIGLENIF